ncbi:MAG TPA: CusA/CzcA family heavy metal efflux RND transporter [Turneriella sp.]|nr:CusA/CzcA family heavy metal efflux RND transporter [Turneriella sp.]
MLSKIVEFSLNHRLSIIVTLVAVLGGGIFVGFQLPVDAVPDITNVQVVVNAKTGGLDPQQVEKSVTYFIETEIAGIPRVQEIRSLARFGLSQTVVIFKDGTDIYWARQQVGEKMRNASDRLPAGVSMEMAPISTGLGEVLMYVLLPKSGSELEKKSELERLLYLRTIQDFVLRPYIKSNAIGIAEVDSLGGFKKQIHIDFEPARLEQYGVTFDEIVQKLKTVGENFGGGYIEKDTQQWIVRTKGQVSLKQFEQIPVRNNIFGSPVRLKEVATIREDHAQRVGAATYKGNEAVLGTVLMLMGENSREVALNAEQVIKNAPLPDDVVAEIVYTRSFLVNATLKTVAKNLAEGAAIVILILLLFLGNLRAALFVSLSIPLAMAFALIGMKVFHISANLMSLGALDFGLIVDGAIVMIENLLAKMEHQPPKNIAQKLKMAKDAALEVLAPMTTGMIIIMSVYIPILTLEGTEGKLYYPMAMTVIFALTGALLMAIVAIPVLGYYVRVKSEPQATKLFQAVYKAYEPILNFPLRNIRKLVLPVVAFLLICGWIFARLGSDFMPPLNEGDMALNLVHDAKISLSESLTRQRKIESKLATYPEIERVFSRIGTSEAATDPMGVNLSDLFVILKKDTSQWRKDAKGKTLDKDGVFKLIEADAKELLEKTDKLAESELVQTQPIAMRFNEILEGSRADISLRIYGSDLDTLAELQDRSVEILKKIKGAREVELDALTALRKSLVFDASIKYNKVAYYGVSLGDVNFSLQTAMAGMTIGSYYEQAWQFPIVVRLSEENREKLSEINRIPIALPTGGTIPLSKVAEFSVKENVTSIARSGLERYAGVAVFLGDRDTLSFVEEAKAKIKEELKIPKGYRLSWGGQFKNLERARVRLAIIVPLILLVILFLVYRTFHSIKQTLLIFLTIPFAWTGGVLALWFTGIHFSVSAAVGFIALSGVAVLNGLVKVSYLNQLRAQGKSVNEAVHIGALGRLRPVLMTASVASLGFLPMVLNTGIGAEVQRPLAIVVLGGLITATLMTLLLLPSFYQWMEKGDEK